MEEKVTTVHKPCSARCMELREKATDDPELARQLKVAKDILKRYGDAFALLGGLPISNLPESKSSN